MLQVLTSVIQVFVQEKIVFLWWVEGRKENQLMNSIWKHRSGQIFQIWVTAGDVQVFPNCFIAKTSHLTLHNLCPPLIVFSFTGVTFLSSKLYVIGGHSPDGALASIERYDTKQEKWTSLKSMNFPRFLLRACAIDGLVYVVGGRNNERSLDTIEVFDPKAKSWTILNEKMQDSRNDFGLVTRDNQIFCIGGRGAKSIECFDVVAKQWKNVGSTGENSFSMSCVFYLPF